MRLSGGRRLFCIASADGKHYICKNRTQEDRIQRADAFRVPNSYLRFEGFAYEKSAI